MKEIFKSLWHIRIKGVMLIVQRGKKEIMFVLSTLVQWVCTHTSLRENVMRAKAVADKAWPRGLHALSNRTACNILK